MIHNAYPESFKPSLNYDKQEYVPWYPGQDGENYFNAWTKLTNPSIHHYQVFDENGKSCINRKLVQYYVCDTCKAIFYHSMTQCPKCPQKLRVIKGTDMELSDKLKGYKLGGM